MSKSQPRIAFVGNIANNFYRELKGAEPAMPPGVVLHLFMRKTKGIANTELPESDEPGLTTGYPSWIKVYPGPKLTRSDRLAALLGYFAPYARRNREIIDTLSSYDLCVFSGPDAILAPFVRSIRVFRATGSDLTVYPIMGYSDFTKFRPPAGRRNPIVALLARAAYQGQRKFYRKSVIESDYIDAVYAQPFEDALAQLGGVPQHKRLSPSRLCVDLDVFKARPDSSAYCENAWSIPPDAFVISLPSRMMIKNDDLHKRTGQWKASDIAIRGVAAFLSSLDDSGRRKVVLAIPDRLLSDDLALGKKLIKELGIEPNVAFIKGSAVQGLTRDELIYLYSRSAAVLDDVGAEWYGAVTVEALSCEAPVITYVSDRYMDRTFPWYPMLTARTESEVAARLSYLFNNRSAIAEIGVRSRAWVQEFHSSANAALHIQRTLLPLIASS